MARDRSDRIGSVGFFSERSGAILLAYASASASASSAAALSSPRSQMAFASAERTTKRNQTKRYVRNNFVRTIFANQSQMCPLDRTQRCRSTHWARALCSDGTWTHCAAHTHIGRSKRKRKHKRRARPKRKLGRTQMPTFKAQAPSEPIVCRPLLCCARSADCFGCGCGCDCDFDCGRNASESKY